jgi:hypothetical protein
MDQSIELQPVYVPVSTKSPQGDETLDELDSFSESLPPKKCSLRSCCCAFLVITTFLSFVGLMVVGATVGLTVSHCLYPPHHQETTIPLDSSLVKSLDLHVIAGSISIRTCPHAKNITIHVKEAAQSTHLLREMSLQTSISNGLVRIVALSPFDLRSCQLSHITVVLPVNVSVDVNAHVVLGHISVHSKLNNVKLSTSIGYIETDRLQADKLDVEIMIGYSSTRSTTAVASLIEVQAGILHVDKMASQTTSLAVGIGALHTRKLYANSSLEMTTFFGSLHSRHFSKMVKAHVDYGIMKIQPRGTFYFEMKTDVGHLDVIHLYDKPKYVVESYKHKIGYCGTDKVDHQVLLSTTYGRVVLMADCRNKTSHHHNDEHKNKH